MARPCSSQRSKPCRAGGGGSDDQPLHYRCSMIQGSNHARTARSAIGQDTCSLMFVPSLIFFPVFPASVGSSASGGISGSAGLESWSAVRETQAWLA